MPSTKPCTPRWTHCADQAPDACCRLVMTMRFARFKTRSQDGLEASTTLTHYYLGLWQNEEGTLYLAMEFIDGVRGQGCSVSGGALPAGSHSTSANQLGGLSAAHARGIIHRT